MHLLVSCLLFPSNTKKQLSQLIIFFHIITHSGEPMTPLPSEQKNWQLQVQHIHESYAKRQNRKALTNRWTLATDKQADGLGDKQTSGRQADIQTVFVSWCFEPSQPHWVISGLTDIYTKRPKADAQTSHSK